MVDAGEPRNAPAAHMQGFLSRDGMPPAALLAVGRKEVARYGVDLIDGRVEHVENAEPTELGFLVHLAGGPVLHARRVVVATGLRDGLPELPGLAERWGRDVLHCPYCHGWEVRDRPLGVLGTAPGSVDQALLLRQWSADVVLLAHTLELTAADRERLAASGSSGAGSSGWWPTTGGCAESSSTPGGWSTARRCSSSRSRCPGTPCSRDDNGWVTTDRTGRTSVPGVWAVGNVADPRAQVVTAAGTGAAAAFALNHDLVDEEIGRAVALRRASGPAVAA